MKGEKKLTRLRRILNIIKLKGKDLTTSKEFTMVNSKKATFGNKCSGDNEQKTAQWYGFPTLQRIHINELLKGHGGKIACKS